ncbi:MAG TPA: hypothetical protein VG895_03740 [Patescibacteria group bacterium]|nr:hypothetical protein [Patescibacteria group bacterium]
MPKETISPTTINEIEYLLQARRRACEESSLEINIDVHPDGTNTMDIKTETSGMKIRKTKEIKPASNL